MEDLGVPVWQQDVIFDLSFHMYRTRDESEPGTDPRRYAWEDGEVCEYRVERGQVLRRTALLVHLQKRVMRAPGDDVLAADRYWVDADGFRVQGEVTPWAVRAARVPRGRAIVPFYGRRVQRNLRRRAARRADRRAASATVSAVSRCPSARRLTPVRRGAAGRCRRRDRTSARPVPRAPPARSRTHGSSDRARARPSGPRPRAPAAGRRSTPSWGSRGPRESNGRVRC